MIFIHHCIHFGLKCSHSAIECLDIMIGCSLGNLGDLELQCIIFMLELGDLGIH